MSQENVEVARRAFEAWQNDDYEAWMALHDADVEYLPSVERRLGRSMYRGHEGASELWSLWRGEVEGFWIVSEEIRDLGGERILHLGKMGFRGSASGMHVDSQLALVITLRDGKIVRSMDFTSHDEALEAVGLGDQAVSEESTTGDPVELVQHLLDALTFMDGDAFVRFFAPDGVFLTGVGRFERRDAIRGYFEDFKSSYDEQSYAADEVHDLGNGVAWFSVVVTGRPRGMSAEVHLRFAVVVTHAGGVVSQWTDYVTNDEARAVAERLAEERG